LSGKEEEQDLAPAKGVAERKTRKSEALWLMTFSDLSFVLLCFFVLLLTFTKTNKERFDNVKNGLKAQATENQSPSKKPQTLSEIKQKLERVIKKKKLDSTAQVTLDNEGVAIEFKDAMLFRSGSAKPNPKFKRVVGQVLRVIAKSPKKYKVIIEGHTDDIPMRGGAYKSNWELSSARGVSMLRQLERRGLKEERMSVIAYAHTKPKVPYKGLKDQKKLREIRASNRRVVIRIL
jgi:chemotaxis protein MotB